MSNSLIKKIDNKYMIDKFVFSEIMEEMKNLRKRWCADEVDDPEEMETEIPEFLDRVVPELEKLEVYFFTLIKIG